VRSGKLRAIGHYFFEDKDGRAVTVTSARYVEMLWNLLTPELSRGVTWLSIVCFQQDGATAHAARASMEIVWKIFPGHVISLRGDLPWPGSSPDLSACDYFLWGYITA
jgi:hypothetical protein